MAPFSAQLCPRVASSRGPHDLVPGVECQEETGRRTLPECLLLPDIWGHWVRERVEDVEPAGTIHRRNHSGSDNCCRGQSVPCCSIHTRTQPGDEIGSRCQTNLQFKKLP